MKKQLVIDANVVIKWFVSENEKYVEQSHHLFQSIRKKKIEVFAPTFLLIEISNILLRKKQLPASTVKQVVEKLHSSGIHFVSFEKKNLPGIIQLCEKFSLTSYDALYLLLAQEMNCKLLTTDKVLLKAKEFCLGFEEWQ